MSLPKPKPKRNTWSQEKRARRAGIGLDGLLNKKNPGVKSQAHLERISRRKVSRTARKQHEEAEKYASTQIAVALASSV